MTSKQQRIISAKIETVALIEKWENRKTFGADQEKEKQQRIAEYKAHAVKLDKMLLAAA